jgi:hypothetical protein
MGWTEELVPSLVFRVKKATFENDSGGHARDSVLSVVSFFRRHWSRSLHRTTSRKANR